MATATIGDNAGNTYAGTDDASIKESTPATNYGASTSEFQIHKYGSGDHENALVKFTGLSNITGPVTVLSATLYLWQTGGDGAATYSIDARRLLRNWVEAQATWNIYSTGNSWSTVGGESDGNDRIATVSATASVGTALQYYAFTGAQLATDVENIINGVNPNYGWHLSKQGTGNDSQYKLFNSSEATIGQRPYLDITYTAGGGGGTPLTFTGSDSLAGGELL